jgi:hypothetical protein
MRFALSVVAAMSAPPSARARRRLPEVAAECSRVVGDRRRVVGAVSATVSAD